MEKVVKARVQHKHDVEANWLKATNFIPLASEIIVYDSDENYNYPRIKIGDGKTNINNLPFVTKDYAKISDIPIKVSDLDNDKEFITAAEVPDEIYVGDGTMPETATIQFIMDASDEETLLKNELQEYIDTELEAAKASLELDIPTKTSQLTNDSGFITADDVPEVQVPDLSDYAKTSDIPTKVSQLTNDSGFITAEDIPEAQVPDLSGYALKSNAETWTFTLSDGSTVTKKVVLA